MRRRQRDPGLIAIPEQEWGGRLPIALVFPQKPALAYSSLGWQAVWQVLQADPAWVVEPVFWDPDRSRILRPAGKRGLNAFGLVAFSLTYEFDYLHLLRVLHASGIALEASQRPSWPLVMAGGALAFLNPAPIAPSVDLFWVGEAEAGLTECMHAVARVYIRNGSRYDALQAVANAPGVFVPGHSALPVRRVVDVRASAGGTLAVPVSSSFTSPDAVFRDTLLLEVNRGCPHGCRFCAAGYMYRPHRQASMEALQEIVLQKKPRKVGLVGTALTDWPDLQPFLEWLRMQKVDVSVSSLRAEGLTEDLLDTLRDLGTRTVTLALEGASQGLRCSMNKHVRVETFLRSIEQISRKGFNHLKIYLLVGWPGETDDDWREFSRFLLEMDTARSRGASGRKANLELISLGLGCLVPKPWTPLQWSAMAGEEVFKERIRNVRQMVRKMSGVQVRSDSPWLARMQGLLARGDGQVHQLISLASLKRGRDQDVWSTALREWPGDPHWYLDRERGKDEVFPWEVISMGVSREHLWREWERAATRRKTGPCPTEYRSGQLELACPECRKCGLDAWLQA